MYFYQYFKKIRVQQYQPPGSSTQSDQADLIDVERDQFQNGLCLIFSSFMGLVSSISMTPPTPSAISNTSNAQQTLHAGSLFAAPDFGSSGRAGNPNKQYVASRSFDHVI